MLRVEKLAESIFRRKGEGGEKVRIEITL